MSEAGLVVVGSGPAGVSAAEPFRRHRVDSPVPILTADPAPPERPTRLRAWLNGHFNPIGRRRHHAQLTGKSAVGNKGGKSGSYNPWTVADLKKKAENPQFLTGILTAHPWPFSSSAAG
jgi:hypothetical protein